MFFSNSFKEHENIFLRDENNSIIRDEAIVADTFNQFFVNITKNLNITPWGSSHSDSDIIEPTGMEYQDHPSICTTLLHNTGNHFSSSLVSADQINKIMHHLNPRKSVSGPFNSKIIRMVSDILSEPLSRCISVAFETSTFPSTLKLADVTPIFKKNDKSLKENYRPVSVLPCLSKVFERSILIQLANYFEKILHTHLCGFRSKYSTQHALLRMIGQWNQCLDGSGKVGAVLMDLSKAFDCIDHDLLLAKLSAYGLDSKSVGLIKCYLRNRFQRTKIDATFSTWRTKCSKNSKGCSTGIDPWASSV